MQNALAASRPAGHNSKHLRQIRRLPFERGGGKTPELWCIGSIMGQLCVPVDPCQRYEAVARHCDQTRIRSDLMSKFVAIIFPSENAAYEGTRALKQLHAEGTLTVYAMAVLAKEANGKIVTKQAVDQGPLGFAVGTLIG